MRRSSFIAVLCCMMLAPAGPALANSPTQSAYSGSGANQITQAGANASPNAQTLPFTGIDLGALSAVGIVLLGTGFILRRRFGQATD